MGARYRASWVFRWIRRDGLEGGSKPRGEAGHAPDRGPRIPPSGGVPLATLLDFTAAVFSELARGLEDGRGDPRFGAVAVLRSSGSGGDASWGHFEVVFPAADPLPPMPLVVTARTAGDRLEWSFGPILIAETPRAASPKEAAGALTWPALLAAFRRFTSLV